MQIVRRGQAAVAAGPRAEGDFGVPPLAFGNLALVLRPAVYWTIAQERVRGLRAGVQRRCHKRLRQGCEAAARIECGVRHCATRQWH